MDAKLFLPSSTWLRTVSLAIGTFGFFGAAYSASPFDTPESIAVIDVSRPHKPAVVYSTGGLRLHPASTLSYFQLSPPLPKSLECCIRISRAQSPSRDMVAVSGEKEIPTRFTLGRLSKRPEFGFMGIAVAGKRPSVTPENEYSVLLKWANSGRELRVQHCVTSETLHVRVTDTASSQEQLRYSLPLGMDVEATCSESIMPMKR